MAVALGLPADPAERRAEADKRLPAAAASKAPNATPTPDPDLGSRVPEPDGLSDWAIQYDDNGWGDQPNWQRHKAGKKHRHSRDPALDPCDPNSDRHADAYDCD
jgi:hypothetical protein